MREMKKTGISWFPLIPVDWQTGRIKDILWVLTDYTANGSFGDLAKNVTYLDYEDYARLVRLTDLRENLKNMGVYVDEDGYNYLSKSSLFGGEILVANVGAYAGLFCEMPTVDYPATLAPNMFLLRTNDVMLQHYLLYVGLSSFVWEQLCQKAISSAQPKLNKTDVKTTFIPIPPISEQKRIADYLDNKCAQFDSTISDIQSQIEALEEYKRSVITEAVTKGLDPDVEMRDSGVDYIGEMNAKWKLTKLRYICEKLNRYFDSDAEALICSNKGEVFPRGDNNFGLVSDNDKMFQGVHKGDLLIHGMDTWHGAIAVSDYDGKCTTVVHVCDSEQNKYFICYFLQMLAFKRVYKAISNGVRENTSDFRSWDKAGHIYITIPDIDEQNRIAEFIKEKVEHINAVIAEKKQQIETIEEYKKSLIFEYVTGKKEVPIWK